MNRLIVVGARGRMGSRICSLAREDPRFEVVGEMDLDDAPGAWPTGACDVVVDFSAPEGTLRAVQIAVATGAALMVGTTGLSAENRRALDDAARSIPVLLAANTALGVAVLNHLAARAARLLGSRFAAEITEAHHAGKRDAPSGTALRLAEVLRQEAGVNIAPECIRSIRSGDIVGDHTIRFTGPGERIEISHSATTRDVFVHGALHAAHWLCGKPPGRYTIEHALGLV